jgi:hypothetical protein
MANREQFLGKKLAFVSTKHSRYYQFIIKWMKITKTKTEWSEMKSLHTYNDNT